MDWDGLLDAGLMGDLLRMAIEVVMLLVGIILTPISALIALTLPDINNALLSIPILFDYANTYLGWILSAFAIPGILLTFMAGYYLFAITSKLAVWPFKLALNWYRALKLGS